MKVLDRAKLVALALTAAGGLVIPTQSYAADDPFDQCLEDHCFGNYVGNPAGYRACWVWCAQLTGGPY